MKKLLNRLVRGKEGANTWPVVSEGQVGVADFRYEMCRAAPYVLLNVFVVNRSEYLVKAAELVIDSLGDDQQVTGTTSEWVGPLIPGVPLPVETSVRYEGRAGGVSFRDGEVHAMALTPPEEMVAAEEYPDLSAEIVEIHSRTSRPLKELSIAELRGHMVTKSEVLIRLHNRGSRTVDRTRLRLGYWGSPPGDVSNAGGTARPVLAEWLVDAQQNGWSAYERSADPSSLESRPAAPIPPGGTHEFSLLHWGTVEGWPASEETTTIDVVAVKLAP